MMKRFIYFLMIVAMIALVVSMISFGKDAGDPYVVGAFVSVSGPNAPLGTPERDTLLMLEAKINQSGGINGHPLKMIIEDDGSDNTNAVKAATKLIEQDNVCAIIGGSGTGPTMAVAPITSAAGVPHISMAAGIAITNPVNKWVFRTAPTDVQAVNKILDYLTKHKITKIAVIYDSGAFGSSGRDQLKKFAPSFNISIVAEESFGSKDTDMMVQLTKIRTTPAQAIVCWGTNPGPSQVAKNVKQLGIKLPLFMSHGVADQAFIDQAGDAANGIILPAVKLVVADALPAADPQKKLSLQYAKDFQEKFGRSADHYGGHAWDALNIIVRALEKAGNDRAKLRDEIEKTKDFVGIGGVFTYAPDNHDGLASDSLAMLKIVNGKWTLVKK